MRNVLVCSALVAMCAAPVAPASAATSVHFCQVLTDPAGDATKLGPNPWVGAPEVGPNEPTLDVLDEGLAADRSHLLIRMHLAALVSSQDDSTGVGQDYETQVDIGSTRIGVAAQHLGGWHYSASVVATQVPNPTYVDGITGVIDNRKGLITISVPFSVLSSLVGGGVAKGTTLANPGVVTSRAVGHYPEDQAFVAADEAKGSATFTIGRKC